MAKKKTKEKPTPAAAAPDAGQRLLPPANGAVVRMYRIGHGDCFLIAFAGKTVDSPVYVLIDCGYKPGSQNYIETTPEKITKNIALATGGHIHVAVITHEHQDHVNAITKENFEGITIGKTWLAWTEDPADDFANELRKLYKDQLLGLVAARNLLAADPQKIKQIDRLLNIELGGTHGDTDVVTTTAILAAAAVDPSKSHNKRSMQVFKDLATNGVKFLKPHDEILTIPGARDLRVFALGPPRNLDLLKSLDPQGAEEFHSLGPNAASSTNYFGAVAAASAVEAGNTDGKDRLDIPFARRYRVSWDDAREGLSDEGDFLEHHYGHEDSLDYHGPVDSEESSDTPDEKIYEVPHNAAWRRIDKDWLYSAEKLALKMNDETNNSSLVLAFELGKGGKVLLFTADAQRGNWLSWANGDWKDGNEKVTTRDLLSRTVLYKAGHHCSHNATLNGLATDDYPNLGWMATGKYSQDFTAMITAVWEWAQTQDNWIHPFPPIKNTLLKKTSGKVFQTDSGLVKPQGTPQVEWDEFLSRAKEDQLYFDYIIPA